jgi:hypothetical protein
MTAVSPISPPLTDLSASSTLSGTPLQVACVPEPFDSALWLSPAPWLNTQRLPLPPPRRCIFPPDVSNYEQGTTLNQCDPTVHKSKKGRQQSRMYTLAQDLRRTRCPWALQRENLLNSSPGAWPRSSVQAVPGPAPMQFMSSSLPATQIQFVYPSTPSYCAF